MQPDDAASRRTWFGRASSSRATLLIAAGVVITAVPLVAFRLGWSHTAFGTRHQLMTMCGLALLSAGCMGKAASERTELPLRRVLGIACCLGLLAGLAEAAILLISHNLLGRGLSFQPHRLWMAPLADLLLFVVVSLVLWLAGNAWSGARSIRTVVWSFVFLGATSVLYGVPGLQTWAGLVLAAGLAVLAARRAAARPQAFYATSSRVLPWAAALLAVTFVGVHAGRVIPEWQAAPAQQRRDGPNVLLIVLDTVRAESLAIHGYERPTSPNLSAFAERSVVFERALATSPWTLPSHGSMFSGRLPHELFRAGASPLTGQVSLQPAHPTLAEVMGGLGYDSVGIVANWHYCGRAHGVARGFAHYEDYPLSLEWFFLSTNLARAHHRHVFRKSAAEVNRSFLSWLDDSVERPFFAFLNYYDAHDPYVVPAPFEARYGANRTIYVDDLIGVATPPQVDALRDGYDSCIHYLDHHIGMLLDELEERGLVEDTIIIVTSDHGEQFGEHGLLGHGNTVYRQLLHVPLLVSFPPHLPAGIRIKRPVSLRDLPATILELVGTPADHGLAGSSLVPLWAGEEVAMVAEGEALLGEVLVGEAKPGRWQAWFPGYEAGLLSLVEDGFHYIRHQRDGVTHEELYDFEADPAEERDLAGSEAGRRRLPALRRAVEAILARTPPPK